MTTRDAALTSSASAAAIAVRSAKHGSNVATALQHGKEHELNLIEDAKVGEIANRQRRQAVKPWAVSVSWKLDYVSLPAPCGDTVDLLYCMM